jgi:cupin 2 domain-containing protein
MTNLLRDLPDASAAEVFTPLLERPGCRIERIVSLGQATPAEAPYRQAHDEWVMLLQGAARVVLEGRIGSGPRGWGLDILQAQKNRH